MSLLIEVKYLNPDEGGTIYIAKDFISMVSKSRYKDTATEIVLKNGNTIDVQQSVDYVVKAINS